MITPHSRPEPHPLVREDVLDCTPYTRSVSLARQRAARLVAEWGHPALAGNASLLLTELATNALLYGAVRGRMIRVRLALSTTVLHISVTDPRGERLPRARLPTADEQFGRGLIIVDAIADRWGVEPLQVGKTVWCELDLGGP